VHSLIEQIALRILKIFAHIFSLNLALGPHTLDLGTYVLTGVAEDRYGWKADVTALQGRGPRGSQQRLAKLPVPLGDDGPAFRLYALVRRDFQLFGGFVDRNPETDEQFIRCTE
jgi:hypothetical protein